VANGESSFFAFLKQGADGAKAIVAVATSVVAVTIHPWLTKNVWIEFGISGSWHWPATILLGLFFLLLLFLIWSGFIRRESQLEQRSAFNLRATDRHSLIGREQDVRELERLVQMHRLTLLDGESGCGKSALVAAGLVPALRESASAIPVLLSGWTDEWERGALAGAIGGLFEAVGEGRTRAGWHHAPDLSVDAGQLAMTMGGMVTDVFAKLGKRVVLILDQFDDYQATNRDRFLTTERAWLPPEMLINENRFWAELFKLLNDKAGPLKLVVVTRADRAAGLSSVRFEGVATATKTLQRVEATEIDGVLLRLVPADAKPPVISRPEAGWDDLRVLLASDLQQRGDLLMQQLRVVLLGLAELPGLTRRRYLAADGVEGLEALYVLRAVHNAMGKSGLGVRTIRLMLDALVDRGDGRGAAKTRLLREAQLLLVAGDAGAGAKALAALAEREVVRKVAEAGFSEPGWRLDHDYLARAVIADGRAANRWVLLLSDGRAAFEEARKSGSAARIWRSLLGPWQAARIGVERIAGRLRFGANRGFFAASLVKPGLTIALVALVGWGVVDFRAGQAAREIASARIAAFDTYGFLGYAARASLIRLSLDDARVAREVVRQMLMHPANASKFIESGDVIPAALDIAVDGDWTELVSEAETTCRGVISPSVDQVLACATVMRRGGKTELAATTLVSGMAAAAGDVDALGSLADGLHLLGARLPAKQAEVAAEQLVTKIVTANGDIYALRRFAEDLGALGYMVPTKSATALANRLVMAMASVEENEEAVAYIDQGLTALGSRLPTKQLEAAAERLVTRIEAAEGDVSSAFDLVTSLGELGDKVSAKSAASLADRLVTAMASVERKNEVLADLAEGVATFGDQLPAKQAEMAAERLVTKMITAKRDHDGLNRLVKALGALGYRVPAESAASLADRLAMVMVSAEMDEGELFYFAAGIAALGNRVSAKQAEAVAERLMTKTMSADGNVFVQSSCIMALGALGNRLPLYHAARAADLVLKQLHETKGNQIALETTLQGLSGLGHRVPKGQAATILKVLNSLQAEKNAPVASLHQAMIALTPIEPKVRFAEQVFVAGRDPIGEGQKGLAKQLVQISAFKYEEEQGFQQAETWLRAGSADAKALHVNDSAVRDRLRALMRARLEKLDPE
jgi:hypothetical protein